MALGRIRRTSHSQLRRNRAAVRDPQWDCCTRAVGRKRVACDGPVASPPDAAATSPCNETPTRRRGRRKLALEMPTDLESLPQEVLVRIMCLVNHSDVEPLLGVSKTIREAAMAAKKWHFAFSTPSPSSKKPVFKEAHSFEYASEGEAPGAPRQCTRAFAPGADGSIVVQLFTDEEDCYRM